MPETNADASLGPKERKPTVVLNILTRTTALKTRTGRGSGLQAQSLDSPAFGRRSEVALCNSIYMHFRCQQYQSTRWLPAVPKGRMFTSKEVCKGTLLHFLLRAWVYCSCPNLSIVLGHEPPERSQYNYAPKGAKLLQNCPKDTIEAVEASADCLGAEMTVVRPKSYCR